MSALRVLAVDEDLSSLAAMMRTLRSDQRVAHVHGATDATAALRQLNKVLSSDGRIDAAFLNVSLRGLSGLELARFLARFVRPPAIVLVSSGSEHATEAFRLDAVDYLVKPLQPECLGRAIERVAAVARRATLSLEEPTATGDAFVKARCGREIRPEDVQYIEAQGDHARVHTGSGSILVRKPISVLEQHWSSAGFIRVHRRHLVAARHIQELRTEAGRVTVRVGTTILPVSRRQEREVREALNTLDDALDICGESA